IVCVESFIMRNVIFSINLLLVLLAISCSMDDIPNISFNNLVSISGKNSDTIKIGQPDIFTIELNNQGTDELIINDIDFSKNDDGAFSFENGKPPLPLKIQAGEKYD